MSLTQFGVADIDALPHRVRKVTLLQRLVNLVNPYRPYRHYMRGPGPKCREKVVDDKAEGVEKARRWLRKAGNFNAGI